MSHQRYIRFYETFSIPLKKLSKSYPVSSTENPSILFVSQINRNVVSTCVGVLKWLLLYDETSHPGGSLRNSRQYTSSLATYWICTVNRELNSVNECEISPVSICRLVFLSPQDRCVICFTQESNPLSPRIIFYFWPPLILRIFLYVGTKERGHKRSQR